MTEEKCCPFHEEREKDIHDLFKITDKLEDRVSELEKGKAVSDEQIKMIFKILEEIKVSVSDIAQSIKDLEKRPGLILYSVGSSITSAILVASIIKFVC